MKLDEEEIKLLETLVAIILFFSVYIVNKRKVNNTLKKLDFAYSRRVVVVKIINVSLLFGLLLVLAAIWKIDSSQVLMYISSLVTILGVGFFATWSLLSNITSGLILFFNHPLGIGDHIKIYDKDFAVEGKITDISYFFLHIKTDSGENVTIPNSVALQKNDFNYFKQLNLNIHFINEMINS